MGNGKTASPQAESLTVGAEEFCRLAISLRNLVRCDDKAVGLRGLKDVETGERFLISERELFAHSVTRA
jgi:hypothetical protein